MRVVAWVTPSASLRTISERRRCRSMPTYCPSIGASLSVRGERPECSPLGFPQGAEAPLLHRITSRAPVISFRAMSVEVCVLYRTTVPVGRDSWQAQLDALRLPVQLDASLDPSSARGFQPVTLRGRNSSWIASPPATTRRLLTA